MVPVLILPTLFLYNASLSMHDHSLRNELTGSTAGFRDGDIIFRRGISLVSHFVFSVDPSSGYSHTGIICKQANRFFVIHVLPVEHENHEDAVRMEPLGEFLSQDNASGFALYRLTDNGNIPGKAANIAKSFYNRRFHYDYDLDYADHQRLYCTELVWLAYSLAGVDLIEGRYEGVDIPFYKGKYILISGLLKSRRLNRVETH